MKETWRKYEEIWRIYEEIRRKYEGYMKKLWRNMNKMWKKGPMIINLLSWSCYHVPMRNPFYLCSINRARGGDTRTSDFLSGQRALLLANWRVIRSIKKFIKSNAIKLHNYICNLRIINEYLYIYDKYNVLLMSTNLGKKSIGSFFFHLEVIRELDVVLDKELQIKNFYSWLKNLEFYVINGNISSIHLKYQQIEYQCNLFFISRNGH